MTNSCTFKARFTKNETRFYLVIWVVSVLYALYRFALVSSKFFEEYEDNYNDFKAGWWLTNIKQDKADFEFETIKLFFKKKLPVDLFYLLVYEVFLIWFKNDKVLKWLSFIFTLTYLQYSMGTSIVLLAIFQPIVFYLFARNMSLTWLINIVCLGLISLCKTQTAAATLFQRLNDFEISLSILLLCWMNLKCTAFALERNNKYNQLVLNYVEYCFYLPTLFTGPFITYEDFIKRKSEKLTVRLIQLTFNLGRCCFWWIFTEFCLHFVYVNATSFQLELIKQFDYLTLCGYGYAMGQFFHLKYVIMYGLSTSLSSFQMIQVPTLPRCIGRVHLYSDMWKYFDPGLYVFLKKRSGQEIILKNKF
ncbi:protein-cysteine N-palmitoyltransferase Rasp isoform X2 [Anthonomus grandis grandis]|uniref:protein-cysteine N-palmitoyltransferase Rasp isoform X2 n=1 Tax=Anthonomus grandis grandis TaxID=2921223 RepID=UPI002165A229|nr:protein-cysteine N-palmitoyltransferase Rasp isoform X2 [Anthonomus grandis grandis]